MLRLTEPTGGKIYYRDTDLLTLTKKELNKIRRELQIVFQDPYESLNPRGFVSDIVSEPLSIQGIGGEEIKEIVARILKTVGLTPVEEFLYRYPHELSGGQRQRVAIARALILEPKFIVADEPVSMIDMSLRAGILNLMMDLRDKFNLSYLYITHDLAVTKYICDRLAIMYLGKVIEKGPAVKLIDEPLHPYARALMEAVPTPDPEAKIGKVPITGEVPTPINMPSGCRFHPRCPYAKSVCKKEEPQMVKIDRDRYVACHLLA